ncbi:hypothetical protein O181_067945 [Austropuccinia psidii MF-1]|uniref:Uncharacterized protein n=1 Tax=Austropuccinia psidii MF-1 TaxID=1389203 RepID=A0A9Q3F025_9BASI|nr:hypothetical protein [Austropuccinia psidii MF-1]
MSSLTSSVPAPSPRPSTSRPILASPMKPSPIPQTSTITNYNLWLAPVAEGKIGHLCHSPKPKYLTIESMCQSGLPENIQLQLLKVMILWPYFSERFVEIVGR